MSILLSTIVLCFCIFLNAISQLNKCENEVCRIICSIMINIAHYQFANVQNNVNDNENNYIPM